MQNIKDEIFDLDLRRNSDLLSEAWSGSDDLIDSFFSLNGDFLKELDDSESINLQEISSNLSLTSEQQRTSPVSSVEPEFHGFLDTNTDYDISQYVNQDDDNEIDGGDVGQTIQQEQQSQDDQQDEQLNEQPALSSSTSDSGLSSENMEMDYNLQSPTMSSSTTELSFQNDSNLLKNSSIIENIDNCDLMNIVPISNEKNLVINDEILFAPTINNIEMNKNKIIITNNKIITTTTTNNTTTTSNNNNININNNNKRRMVITNNNSPTKIYKVSTGTGVGNGIITDSHSIDMAKKNLLENKSIKIYKLPSKNGGDTTTKLVSSVGGSTICSPSASFSAISNDKVRIKMNNAPNPNKDKLTNNNGYSVRIKNTSNKQRSILLPVSFQDVKNLRTIKIINSSANNKSANIKLAAANLLQQSKQGLIQKNVVFSKEQLIDDSMSDQTSDAESFIFEDIVFPPSSNMSHVSTTSSSLNEYCSGGSGGGQSSGGESSSESSSIIGGSIKATTNHHHNQKSSYPKLNLSNEEKRLLEKEGIALPGNYPLTKHEERELKRIRRKIRNKISAQDSRKRKKEYVDGLEERVKQCTDENQTLIKRLKLLQSQHNLLQNQVKKLQATLAKGSYKTTQPATCLMVLLMSLALVTLPNLKLGKNTQETELADMLQESLLQNRRTLLFDTNEQLGDALVDEEMHLDDILAYNELNDETVVGSSSSSSNNIAAHQSTKHTSKVPKLFIDFDVDDKRWGPPPAKFINNGDDNNEKIDDISTELFLGSRKLFKVTENHDNNDKNWNFKNENNKNDGILKTNDILNWIKSESGIVEQPVLFPSSSSSSSISSSASSPSSLLSEDEYKMFDPPNLMLANENIIMHVKNDRKLNDSKIDVHGGRKMLIKGV